MKNLNYLFLLAIASIFFFLSCNKNNFEVTKANLQAAFNGESTASAKYAAFAQHAQANGNTSVAALFEAASMSESTHAANLRAALVELGVENPKATISEFEILSMAENIQAAIDGENYEVSTMYPEFLERAKAEKCEKAMQPFQWAIDTEVKHHEFYTAALNSLDDPTFTIASAYVVCPKCGNTYKAGEVEETCTFCMEPKANFVTFGIEAAIEPEIVVEEAKK